ncbi:MAG TPA: L,D-transpeptidase [Thermoanaerobaculia bacterium]|nr:L,D-transpeptidase [Thermoanaerobaculia bacterium]
MSETAHRKRHASLLAVLMLAGCVRRAEQAANAPEATPAPPAADRVVVSGVPIAGYRDVDRKALEAGRLDAAWLASATLDWQRRQRAATPAVPPAPTTAATGGEGVAPEAASTTSSEPVPIEQLRAQPATTAAPAPPAGSEAPARTGNDGAAASESWAGISPEAFTAFRPRLPIRREDGGPTVLALQQLLDRVRFSPGVIDGRWGKNTEKAVYWLQAALGLDPNGKVDEALFSRLSQAAGTTSPVRRYTVTEADLAGPFAAIPEEYTQQAALECLCYESAREKLAERFHADPELLAKLNPGVDLERLAAGAELWVPDVEPLQADDVHGAGGAVPVPSPIAEILVSKDGFYLQALDAAGKVLYHFPTTVGAGYDESPSGELAVTGRAYTPTFHYQPKLFADVADTEPEAMLPAGPNSPVGLVWVQLSKENFGIHGTAEPANIGYSTSHGCVRLTNWDALFLARRLGNGVPVRFSDGAESAAAAPVPERSPSPAPAR